MIDGPAKTVTLVAVRSSNGIIGPYSSILLDSVDRLNEISSIIRDKSVVVTESAYNQMEFLLSGSKTLVFTDVDTVLEHRITTIRKYNDQEPFLRRHNDACFVLGGSKAFIHFYPIAWRILVAPINAILFNNHKLNLIDENDWELSTDRLDGRFPSKLLHFQEYYRSTHKRKSLDSPVSVETS